MGPAGEQGTISPAERDKGVAGNRKSEGSETVPKGCRWQEAHRELTAHGRLLD